jgi:hypothetical protein
MRGDIIPLPQYAFMAWCSVKKKHRATTLRRWSERCGGHAFLNRLSDHSFGYAEDQVGLTHVVWDLQLELQEVATRLRA